MEKIEIAVNILKNALDMYKTGNDLEKDAINAMCKEINDWGFDNYFETQTDFFDLNNKTIEQIKNINVHNIHFDENNEFFNIVYIDKDSLYLMNRNLDTLIYTVNVYIDIDKFLELSKKWGHN